MNKEEFTLRLEDGRGARLTIEILEEPIPDIHPQPPRPSLKDSAFVLAFLAKLLAQATTPLDS